MMSNGFRQKETAARQPGRLFEASFHAPRLFLLSLGHQTNLNRAHKLRQIALSPPSSSCFPDLLTRLAAPVTPSLSTSIVRQELLAALKRMLFFVSLLLDLFLM
jgi:hypothetical protein